jgi:hypothetical protein
MASARAAIDQQIAAAVAANVTHGHRRDPTPERHHPSIVQMTRDLASFAALMAVMFLVASFLVAMW